MSNSAREREGDPSCWTQTYNLILFIYYLKKILFKQAHNELELKDSKTYSKRKS